MKDSAHLLTYKSWWAMIARCTDKEHVSYPSYGGRGITVCSSWFDYRSFAADMGHRPSSDYSLDRIDPDKGYFPENCRWATRREQQRNKTNTVRVVYKGQSIPLAEAVDLSGLSYQTVRWRLKQGWSSERAIETPTKHNTRVRTTYLFEGNQLSLNKIAVLSGISTSRLYGRVITQGLTIEEAIRRG